MMSIIIGNVGRSEREMWKQACETADESVARYYPDRLKVVSAKFREFGVITVRDAKIFACSATQPSSNRLPVVVFSRLPYQAEDLHQCFDPNAEVDQLACCAPAHIKQFWYDVGLFLSC